MSERLHGISFKPNIIRLKRYKSRKTFFHLIAWVITFDGFPEFKRNEADRNPLTIYWFSTKQNSVNVKRAFNIKRRTTQGSSLSFSFPFSFVLWRDMIFIELESIHHAFKSRKRVTRCLISFYVFNHRWSYERFNITSSIHMWRKETFFPLRKVSRELVWTIKKLQTLIS